MVVCVCWYELVCVGVCWCMLMCIGVYRFGLVCAGIRWFVLGCVYVHWFVMVSAGARELGCVLAFVRVFCVFVCCLKVVARAHVSSIQQIVLLLWLSSSVGRVLIYQLLAGLDYGTQDSIWCPESFFS